MPRTINKFIALSFLGALLLACNGPSEIKFTVKNELNVQRSAQIVQINWDHLNGRLENQQMVYVALWDSNDRHLPLQWIQDEKDSSHANLIFQSDFQPLELRSFILRVETQLPVPLPSRVYARFVPQRKDDFAWENDRIAFRMYGPALQATGEISSGVDVWVKSTPELVINKWYQPGNNYHKDHGEGLDGYKVGPSRGCGGLALWDGEKLLPSNNFNRWRIQANGPLRTRFKLSYKPWAVGNKKVWEEKQITLDAGQNLNRFQSTFRWQHGSGDIVFAVGIVKRAEGGTFKSDLRAGWMGYWEAEQKPNGHTACGVVMDPQKIIKLQETADHYLLISKVQPGKPAVYFAGAGWSKSGQFADAGQWFDYLQNFSQTVKSDLKIRFD